MTFPGRNMVQGTITVPETLPSTVKVNCGFVPSKVELINMSAITSMAGGPPPVNPTANYLTYRAVWQSQFASAATPFTLVEGITPSAATSSLTPITSNGISTYDGHGASPYQLSLGPKITGSNTAKATATFTITSTATLFPGATILMTSNSVNTQLRGVFFTVNTVVNSTTFTIANAGWLNTANFTDGAETFFVQLVNVPSLYYPQNAQIAAISAANPAVVTTTVNTNLTVGQQVRIYVPSIWGMTQANFQTAIVSAVSGNQVTLGGLIALNSSAFTAFAWPAAGDYPFTGAWLVPIGSGPTPTTFLPAVQYNYDTLDDATTNQAYQGFVVGSGILVADSTTVFGVNAGDIFAYTAWRQDA